MSATYGSGTLTNPADYVEAPTTGMAQAAFQLKGNLSAGSVTVIASNDGFVNYDFLTFYVPGFALGGYANLLAADQYDGISLEVPCVGWQAVRLLAQNPFTGPLTVYWTTSTRSNLAEVNSKVVISGTVPVTIPTPVPVTVADGADVAEGSTTDAAVTSDSDGTLTAFLRGVVAILANVWNPDAFHVSLRSTLMVDPSFDASAVTFAFGYEQKGPADYDGTTTVLPPGVSGAGHLLFKTQPYGIANNAVYAQRVPDTFKTVATAANGNTALWTPAAGKKFRLMGYRVDVTGNAAAAAGAVKTISLFDGAAGATGLVHSVFVPGAALAAGALYTSGWIDLGKLGYLSTAANNVLNVNLSTALTAGVVRVIACGTEE